MGQPATVRAVAWRAECIGTTRGTGGTETSQYLEEEKSTRDSRSSGERTGKSPNRARTGRPVSGRGCRAASVGRRKTSQCKGTGARAGSGSRWEAAPERVRVPYAAPGGAGVLGAVPEYHGTRDILWEAGGTTLQG